ncbi:MAG: PTS sugar transporter subunit IIA [Thermoproteota archaeon]|nr:MAG: PTS sugar transporter subunit IIA [Candidatus Korarchaeota archaeon]
MEMEIFVVTNLDAENSEEVIRKLGSVLLENGFVKPSFIPATIERERSVPTGLELMGGINVALPHAGVEHVIKPALAVAKLKKEVEFRRMDEPESKIPVRIVFMPAIENPHSYIVTLQKLVEIFKNPDLMREIAGRENPNEIKSLLASHLARILSR